MAGPSGSTPILTLPYPIPDDTVDVPRDIQALATKLDGISSLRPPLVSSLPGTPVDGQEIYYLADPTNGVIWHLRYRAASASPYKWEFVGGSELRAWVGTGDTTTSPTLGNLVSTPGPTIFNPLVGDYLVRAGCQCGPASAIQNASIGLTSTLSPAPGDNQHTISLGGAGWYGLMEMTRVVTLTAVGQVAGGFVQMQYATNAGTATFSRRVMTMYPLRVG